MSDKGNHWVCRSIQEDWLVSKWMAICVPCLDHFIDDGFGVWVHNADADEEQRLWNKFKDDMSTATMG